MNKLAWCSGLCWLLMDICWALQAPHSLEIGLALGALSSVLHLAILPISKTSDMSDVQSTVWVVFNTLWMASDMQPGRSDLLIAMYVFMALSLGCAVMTFGQPIIRR